MRKITERPASTIKMRRSVFLERLTRELGFKGYKPGKKSAGSYLLETGWEFYRLGDIYVRVPAARTKGEWVTVIDRRTGETLRSDEYYPVFDRARQLTTNGEKA